MKHFKSIARTVVIGTGCTLLLMTNPVAAQSADRDMAEKKDNSVVVKCYRNGASIQKAINKVKPGKTATIYIKGSCDERVLIDRDGITLNGDKNGNGTIGGGLAEVVIDAASRTVIQSLEISGAGYGVLAENGSRVKVLNSHIHDNAAGGIGAGNLSLLIADNNVITGNGGGGIEAWAGSVVRSAGNWIAENDTSAIEIGTQSYFRSSSLDGGADPDVILQKGCTRGQVSGTCGEPDTWAIDTYRSALTELRDTDVTGFAEINGLANLDVRDSSINGDIEAYGGSRIHLRDSVGGSGLVTCYSESFSSTAIGCGDVIPSL
jgi:hypothetical protein